MRRILLFLFFSFTSLLCYGQNRLHEKALLNLEKDCINFGNCHVINELKKAFEEKRLEGAFEVLIKNNSDCEPKLCFYFSLLRAKILNEKDLIDEAIEEYSSALVWRDRLVGIIDVKHFEIEKVMAVLFLKKKDHQAARDLLLNWLRENPRAEAERKNAVFHNLGISYIHLKRYDSAEYFLKGSVELKEQIGDSLGLLVSYMDLANLYYNQYKDDLAIPLFQRALVGAKKIKDQKPEVLRNAYLNMAVVEENRKDFKKSLEYRKAYEKIQKELWDRDKVWELAEKEKVFEVERREREIAVQEAELNSQQWQINTYLSVSVLLLILMGSSFWGYQKVKNSNRLISAQKIELEELNQTKDRLFGIVAHDLRSPVVSLRNRQEELIRAVSENDLETAQTLTQANEKLLDRTYQLLNNTLQWALDQTGQLVHRPESLSPIRLLQQVLYDYEPIIEAKGLTLETNYQSKGMVEVDPHMFKTAVRNLLDNAIKFTESEGLINISVEDHSNDVVIKITDTGCGMEEEQLAILFEAAQGKIKKDTEGNTGTGLGTVLVQTFIEKNGGSVHAESKVGEGTSFEITFPLIEVD